MRRIRSFFAPALAVFLAGLAPACSTSTDDSAETNGALNYRNTSGFEWDLSASVIFTLKVPGNEPLVDSDARAALATEQATKKLGEVMQALNNKLQQLLPEAVRLKRGASAVNVRQLSIAAENVREFDDGNRFMFELRAVAASDAEFINYFPMIERSGQRGLDIKVGDEEVFVTFRQATQSRNSYPRYEELFEDGLDIDIHFGGDHHDPPLDVAHARGFYEGMVAGGFRSPVARFEDLKLESGPLTRTIRHKGELIPVRVRITHVDMTTPQTRGKLIDAFKKSAKDSDVVIYSGHAGQVLDYSGVVVAYKPDRVALPATKFREMEMPEKYQVFLFNGCETYVGYADSLYANPAKNSANLNVVTTVNFSALQAEPTQVLAFTSALIDQKEKSGDFWPHSWDGILSRMNAAGDQSWVHVYGVHGTDNNPKRSPTADPRVVGKACRKDADCGTDALCIDGKSVCGMACVDDAACPSGTVCRYVRAPAQIDERQCVSAR
jgi:hypothetical protein